MISVSKNVYIDKLDDIVGEYNNTYHRIIKIKPVDVKDNTYIDFKICASRFKHQLRVLKILDRA